MEENGLHVHVHISVISCYCSSIHICEWIKRVHADVDKHSELHASCILKSNLDVWAGITTVTDWSLGPGLCSVSDTDIVDEASRLCSEVKWTIILLKYATDLPCVHLPTPPLKFIAAFNCSSGYGVQSILAFGLKWSDTEVSRLLPPQMRTQSLVTIASLICLW